jgi:hypothetical protein
LGEKRSEISCQFVGEIIPGFFSPSTYFQNRRLFDVEEQTKVLGSAGAPSPTENSNRFLFSISISLALYLFIYFHYIFYIFPN